jgi:polyhydroxybutyrate depolymerase
MQRLVWTVVLAILVALAGQGTAARSDRPIGEGEHDIRLVVGNRTRHYLLHVPPEAVRQGPLPVVIALHGGGTTAIRLKAYAGLDQLADRDGFVVVYPEGSGPIERHLLTWNAGDCCVHASERGVDDVGFILDVLRDVARRLPVDRTRVYITGHSNGAMMAYRMAAEVPERIAAIAPVAGAMAVDRFAPALPVPVLHIHSVNDGQALYMGGVGAPFPLTDIRVLHRPVEPELARWVERNGCPAQAQVRERRAGPAQGDRPAQTATLLVHAPCATGAEVWLWKLTGVGHTWPGSNSRIQERLIGPDTELVDAAEEVWGFLKRFTRPDAPPL